MAKSNSDESKKEKTGGSLKKKEQPLLSITKKKTIFGLLLWLVGFIQLLSILSYSTTDIANLNWEIIKPAADGNFEVNNWLGILGAYLGHFFVRDVFGYYSLIFPVITCMWGAWFLFELPHRRLINISNFLILYAFLLASLMGVLKKNIDLFTISDSLTGRMGNIVGSESTKYLGLTGSVVSIVVLMLVLLVISIDLKILKLLTWLKDSFITVIQSSKEKSEEDVEPSVKQPNAGEQVDNKPVAKKSMPKKDESIINPLSVIPDAISNLEKIKKLRTEPKTPAISKIEKEIKEEEEPIAIKPINIVRGSGEEAVHPVELALPVVKQQSAGKLDTGDKTQEKTEKPEKKKQEDAAVNFKPLKVVDSSDGDKMPGFDELQKLPDCWDEKIDYTPLPLTLLQEHKESTVYVPDAELKRNGELLQEKLALFQIEIQKISVIPGPVVTLFEIVPAPGIKISRIVGLENDIALALSAQGVRIIAPIPGKGAIGVEIPNANPSMVGARGVIEQMKNSNNHKRNELPLALGKTISGEVYIADLAKIPHLLIAGATGSGKSVGINMILASLLYAKHPSEVKFAIIDPKKIELSFYKNLRHHYLAITPDLDEEIITVPDNAKILLKSLVLEMEKRYDMFAKAYVRSIVDYNTKVSNPATKPKDSDKIKHHYLPYIVVVIDELADLMLTAGKEIEEPIARIAQMARAVGIHLVVATQRPSVNVITGVIKANFSARLAYQTASKIDSRTILDQNGAQQLLGRGDMLYLPSGHPKPIRIQNAFITTDEVEIITNYINNQPGFSKAYMLPSIFEIRDDSKKGMLNDLDPLFEDAAKIVVALQTASASMLQRKLKLGYSRAARIVDQLEIAGICGGSDGSKGRQVLVNNEDELELLIRNL